jgi:putative acetyltransferase
MKVSIRHSEPEDFEALREIFAQPKAMAGTLQMPYPSEEMWKKRLSDVPKGMYSLVACVNGDVVGNLTLFQRAGWPRRQHAGELGMAVHDRWQNKGVGGELMAAAIHLADNWLNLVRLELTVYTDNQAAIHLYEKWGFQREGTMTKYAFRDGSFADALMMARIRDANRGPASGSV